MPSSQIERKLAAIMFTDIAGYTELSSKDETKALNLLDIQKQILTPIVNEFNGILHKEMGDGFLFTFATVTEAVKCGIKIQEQTNNNNDLNLRIGIHEGEITLKDGDVLGDDVNVASRIETFAPIGGIAISNKVQQNISSLAEFETKYIGEPELKGVSQEIKVYCITSNGLPYPDDKASSIFIKNKRSFYRRIIFSFTGIIITVIGAMFWFVYPFLALVTGEDNKKYDSSIAILYFETSGNLNDSFFSDGLTEEIISRISRVKNLKVIPRTDVKKYRSINLSLNEIANELEVNYILEGMVRKNNNQVRVNVSLVSNIDNTIIWNKAFDKQVTSVFEIQDQIAEDIANSLDIKISGDDYKNCLKRPTSSYKAYENMSKVKSRMMSLDMFNFMHANVNLNFSNDYIDLLKESIELDPYYSEPYAYLSLFSLFNALGNFTDNGNVKESDSLLFVSISYSDKALEYDEKNEIALSVNIMLPLIAKLLTCNNFYDYKPSPIEVREAIKKTTLLSTHYPDSPLTNLIRAGLYVIKSNTAIISEQDDIEIAEKYMLNCFNRSKQILYNSPNDGITYYTFYLSTYLLSDYYIEENKLVAASGIVEDFISFSEDYELLSNLFPWPLVMSIGSVFKSSHQYEKTNKISKLALNNALHLNSPSENINSIYIHVARSYYDLEEYDSSKYYFEKALNVLASSDYYKNHINNYLTSIKVNEGKYIEAIEELNLLIKTFEMNQDTINILLSLQNILTPLKKIDEIEDLNANIEKIKLYIDNYTLSSEQLMSIHWVISQVLRQTNIKASEYHKNRAIFNMNEFIKMFNSVEDKNLLISNHKTIKEIKTFAN